MTMEKRLITYKERVLYYKIVREIEAYLKAFKPEEEPDIDFVTDIIHAITKYPYKPDPNLEPEIEQYGYYGQKRVPNERPK